MANKTDFTLPKDAYATFDATSIKQLIRDRLNENSTFTGQNFEGSNISSFIDIIAYSYHVLLYYLNQTSSEATFTEAELYENMNRIVKSLDYKPIGTQSCNLAFEAVANEFVSQSSYTIPRYSSIIAGGVPYSFIKDASFNKILSTRENLSDFSESNLLYQGKYQEYPLVTALGDDFETVTLIPGDVIIDHFSIDVYVRDAQTNVYSKWERVDSLYLESSESKAYELRYNENGRYEIKFGNNRTGKRLNANDTVAIYYLRSNGENGVVGPGAIDNASPILFNTVQFRSIFDQVKDSNINYSTQTVLNNIIFSNVNASSEFFTGETVDDIRERAPKVFSAQHRLLSKNDFESFVIQNYNNFIDSIKVVNNEEYVNGHLDYLITNLDQSTPSKLDSRTVLNQALFADACDFNNVYMYCVPRVKRGASTIVRSTYLSSAQKNAVLDGIRDKKVITSEPILMDPVYMAVSPGTFDPTVETLGTGLVQNTIFRIEREVGSSRSLSSIKNEINGVINSFFNNVKLGDTVAITSIGNNINDIEGVDKIFTVRTDTGQTTEGINFLIWNPVYPVQDIRIISADLTLPYFKFPYLYDSTNFLNKIDVVAV